MTTTAPAWTALPASVTRQEKILITVKAYPNPSKKYIETVCVAGVTEGGQWIRLYPIPYRALAYDQRFPNYTWIEAAVRKSRDHRPESHYVDLDTIRPLSKVGTEHNWQERRRLLLPLTSTSIEYLIDQNRLHRTSLGLIRPKNVKRLVIKNQTPEWSADELAKLRQRSLLDALGEDSTYEVVKELEKIPYRFMYEFECDDARCHGHRFEVISWEVLESYRNFRSRYGETDWQGKFRQRYEEEFLGPTRDLCFYVGTVSSHPGTWTIIGLFYPPARPDVIQPSMF
jgi:hypothetical protein